MANLLAINLNNVFSQIKYFVRIKMVRFHLFKKTFRTTLFNRLLLPYLIYWDHVTSGKLYILFSWWKFLHRLVPLKPSQSCHPPTTWPPGLWTTPPPKRPVSFPSPVKDLTWGVNLICLGLQGLHLRKAMKMRELLATMSVPLGLYQWFLLICLAAVECPPPWHENAASGRTS